MLLRTPQRFLAAGVSGNLRTTPYTKLRKQENQNGTTKNI
jgi:hypothetical protein